jgi:hypothetical protein
MIKSLYGFMLDPSAINYKKVKLAGRYEWSNHQTGLEILPPDAE